MHVDLDALIRRVKMIVSLGRLKLTDDTGPIQKHQVDMGPKLGGSPLLVHDNVPHIKEFGFASVPPADSDLFVAFLTGDRSSGVILGSNHQPSRLKNLQPGDAALYDVRGVYVWLTSNGPVIDAGGLDVTIQNAANVSVTATTLITLDAPNVKVTHNLEVDGNITAPSGTITAEGAIISTGGDIKDSSGKTLAQVRTAYDGHTHGGVQGGSSNTGGPNSTV